MANTKDDSKAETKGTTKANATDAKTPEKTTSAAKETEPEAAKLEAAKNACNAARQRIYQDVKKYPEFKLLYVKGTKGKMPRLLEPETPFADERMVKAYAKLKRDFDSLIAARNAQDETRDAMEQEAKPGKPKGKKSTSGTKVPASPARHDATKQTHAKADAAADANDTGTPQKPSKASKASAGKMAGDGNAPSSCTQANGTKRKEAHTSTQKATDKAKAGKPKDAVKRDAAPEDDVQRQKDSRSHETAVTAPDDAKAPDGKQTAQRDASGDGTVYTSALAKDTATKAIAKADASVTHAIKKATGDKEGGGHGTQQGNDGKGQKPADTANGHDEKDAPRNDAKDGNGTKPVTEGNTQASADGNRQKAKASTDRAQKDKASVTSKAQKPKAPANDKTQKQSAAKAQKTADAPKPADNDKSEQPSKGTKTVHTHGGNAGKGKKVPKGESAADAASDTTPKGMPETQRAMSVDDHDTAGNDGKASNDAAKASRSHAVTQRTDKVDSPDGSKRDETAKPSPASHVEQPSEPSTTADGKKPTHMASDGAEGKHAEIGDAVAHADGRQDAEVPNSDDITCVKPHEASDTSDMAHGDGGVLSGITPSDGRAKAEVEAADEPLAQTAAEQDDMNDRMSCHDDALTCSFNKAPDEVVERIGTLEDDAIHGAPVYAHRSKAQWNHDGVSGRVRVRTEIGTESRAANVRHAGAEAGFLGRIGRAFRSLFKR